MKKLKKIPLTKAKDSIRYAGIGLNRKETALFKKMNETIDGYNILIKEFEKSVKKLKRLTR